MEKSNPLLPFAFSTSSFDEKSALSTDPRDKHVIDENARSSYHTRGQDRQQGPLRRAAPLVMPQLKRKMGESFNEKDDIKRRDFDDFNDPSSDEDEFTGATDTDPDSRQSVGPQSSQYVGKEFPSSPPVVPQMSEFDISTTTQTVPDSPVQINHAMGSLNTSPVHKKKPRFVDNRSSEPDFGIGPFNSFKTSSYIACPSTDTDYPSEADPTSSAASYALARHKILQAFEDVTASISLEGMGLAEIPEEVRDLNNLVIFSQDPNKDLYQLYLTNNHLRSINPALFAYTKLNVLSLRQNYIRFIPASIKHLTNLCDLNIATNHLRYLPVQILDLPNLSTFRAGPNPFISIPVDAIEIPQSEKPSPKYVSQVIKQAEETNVPSLKTLCLHTIAKYDVTYSETHSWKRHTPRVVHHLIAKAIAKGMFEDTCSECDTVVVEPYAEVYEWWDVLKNTNVPFKREFCCGKCVRIYKARTGYFGSHYR
ncbi:hypothetical protein FT663_03579 [Candidozyma haemuli var. vulneris]|uniref:Leucine-rich repeat-containing protein 58 n=1 Tax=Candidozyma haemuli TaxID=45357 RepID=A0A2V1AQC2_9ASCO|nr:hypothetical protein CXQ85_001719 [[Candida] haemuloni]KAF3989553.1 hypothetical protein FT663_03579 [[Candida] haemuloni var. vulneris]KAF3989820.1 hypothetical protein FT662_02600 [[Candida] haemuloni var. vulneris]PVH19942.1 hypothetical protein CXQ85_001719 [[Candida] haemuloni]